MRKKLQGGRYLTLETRKDGTKFTSRGLREAAESLQGISRSYNDKQAQLVDEVMMHGAAGSSADLSRLTVIFSFISAPCTCTNLHFCRPHQPVKLTWMGLSCGEPAGHLALLQRQAGPARGRGNTGGR